MALRNLNDFISLLEKENELIRIKNFVDPELEITEITDRFSKLPGGGKALLFENTGTDFPVLTNAMGSDKRICLALGVKNLKDFGDEINEMMQFFTSPKKTFLDKIKILPQLNKMGKWMPKSISGRGKCQEVIQMNPDLFAFPVLKCWPADGGRFVTLPMVHTVDPHTGSRNVGMYRMQILDSKTTGMHWHLHKTGAKHYGEYKKTGGIMPVAVAIGGDPAYTYSATAPLPEGIDEYILAGFIRKKSVKLVKCITQDIEVPSDCDIVIEGYVDPAEEMVWEGPFGDHTGFYSLEDWYPRFHVTCITHKKNAIYPATIVGVPPMEDAWIAEATGKIFFTPMKFSFAPELVSMDLPVAGVAHNLAILAIDNRYPGQAFKVINALWGAGQMMFNKVMVVVDKSDTALSYQDLFARILNNLCIPDNILFSKGPLDVLDHASDTFAYGGKIGIDATYKISDNENQQKQVFPKIFGTLGIEGIECINTYWLDNGVPIVLFSIIQGNKFNPIEILNTVANNELLQSVKLFVCFNSGVDLFDDFLLLWLCLANIDPLRDFLVKERPNGENFILIDATFKSREIHNFTRPWPNIVASDEETICKIDTHWSDYFTIGLIPSPSLKYRSLRSSKGATAFSNK